KLYPNTEASLPSSASSSCSGMDRLQPPGSVALGDLGRGERDPADDQPQRLVLPALGPVGRLGDLRAWHVDRVLPGILGNLGPRPACGGRTPRSRWRPGRSSPALRARARAPDQDARPLARTRARPAGSAHDESPWTAATLLVLTASRQPFAAPRRPDQHAPLPDRRRTHRQPAATRRSRPPAAPAR